MAIRLSTGAVNFILDSGFNTLFDTDGAINIYGGTIPADADQDVGGGALLATLLLSANWIGAAAAGVMTVAPITSDVSVDASGTPTWFRIHDISEGPTGVSATKKRIDGTVGTSGADLNFSSTTWIAGGTAAIGTFTITMPRS